MSNLLSRHLSFRGLCCALLLTSTSSCKSTSAPQCTTSGSLRCLAFPSRRAATTWPRPSLPPPTLTSTLRLLSPPSCLTSISISPQSMPLSLKTFHSLVIVHQILQLLLQLLQLLQLLLLLLFLLFLLLRFHFLLPICPIPLWMQTASPKERRSRCSRRSGDPTRSGCPPTTTPSTCTPTSSAGCRCRSAATTSARCATRRSSTAPPRALAPSASLPLASKSPPSPAGHPAPLRPLQQQPRQPLRSPPLPRLLLLLYFVEKVVVVVVKNKNK